MKKRYKIILVILFVLIMGNFMYLFDWSRDMLKGYWIGNIVGVVAVLMIFWMKDKK